MSLTLSMRGLAMAPKSSSAVVGGGAPAPPGPFTQPLIAGLGASRIRQSGLGLTGAHEIAGGMLTWMRVLEPRLQFTNWYETNAAVANSSSMNGMLFANDGNTFQNMQARLPKLQASDTNIVVLDLVTNSLQFGDTVSSYCAYPKAQALALAANGKLPLIVSLVERPTTTGGVWGSGQAPRLLIPSINAEMSSWCVTQGFPYADIRSSLVDLVGADHEPLAAMVRDGTHWSPTGAYTAALIANAALAPFINASAPASMSTGSELLANVAFTGTGGSVTGTNFTGTCPTSWALTRMGATTNAVIVASIVAGAIRLQIDTTGMGASDIEGVSLTVTAPTLVSTNWYSGKVDFNANAWDGWKSFAIPRVGDSTAQTATGLEGINSGATPVSDPANGTPIAFPTVALAKTVETFAMKAAATSGIYTVKVMFGKGTSGGGDISVSNPSMKQITDPTALMYSEADVTPISVTTSATQTFPEETAYSLQLATNKTYAKWALSGADAAKFSVDNFGLMRALAVPDFESPTDVGTDNVYNVTATATDFNPANGTSAVNLAITISNVADGTLYTFTGTDGTDLADWNAGITRDGTTGAISINTNRAKNNLSIVRTAYIFPQEGASSDVEVRFDLPNAASATLLPAIVQDVGNYIGLTLNGGVFEVTTRVAAGVPNHGTTFPPYKTITTSDKFIFQRLGNTASVYQNGVLIGSRDVTGIITGVMTAGLVSNTGAGSSNAIDNFNIRLAVPITSLVGLYAITVSPTTGTAGTDYLGTFAGKTANSDISVTSVTGPGGTWTADGLNLRGSSLVAGSHVITVTESYPGAVNDGRTSNMTITVS